MENDEADKITEEILRANSHKTTQQTLELLESNKILSIAIQKPLVLVEKAADEVRTIKHRLEPVIIYQNSFNFEQEYAQSASMFRMLKELRTYVLTH